MAKKSSKPKLAKKPVVKENFEKSVIKEMESSKLRIKPWVLQVIGGIFIIIGLFFVVYPFVSDRVSIKVPDFVERIGETISRDDRDDQDGEVDDDENDDEDEDEEDEDIVGNIAGGESTRRDTASTPISLEKAQVTTQAINTTGVWRATDYQKDDIKTGTYQVHLGDTLWEIAEAVYGDGAQWTRILESNSSGIGFLPNGSQALIVPGQFLTIP